MFKPATEQKLTPLALVALGIGAFLLAHDFVGVGTAVPAIQGHFSVDLASMQWAITGFSTAIAVTVLPAGRLADAHGPGRTFVIGVCGFAAASALIACAPGIAVVLVGRVLAGVAGGFLWVSTISLVFTHFGVERAGLAGAFLVGISGLGTAMGAIDSGLLTEAIGWRAVFLLNVPLGLFAGLAMIRHRAFGTPTGATEPIDWTGVTIFAGALVVLMGTLRYAPEWGWSAARTLVGLFFAAGGLYAFARRQRRRGERALVPPDVVRNRVFSSSVTGQLLLGGCFYCVLAFGPQLFANVLGASAIGVGLMQAPTMLAFACAGALAGPLSVRLPAAVTVPSAGALAAVGALLLAAIPDDPSYPALLPGLILVGAGTGAAFSALLTIGVESLPPHRGGLAGGLLHTSQFAGGAIVLATATAVATAVAAGAPGDGLVAGARSGFLIGTAFALIGIVATLVGYGGAARRRRAG